MNLQLPLPLYHIPHQFQTLQCETLHIHFPITTARLVFPSYRLCAIPCNSYSHVARRAIPSRSSSRTSGSAFANGIGTAKCLSRMFRKPGDDLWSRPFVVLNVLRGPARVGDARLEGVKCETSLVILGCTGKGEKSGGDETARCLARC